MALLATIKNRVYAILFLLPAVANRQLLSFYELRWNLQKFLCKKITITYPIYSVYNILDVLVQCMHRKNPCSCRCSFPPTLFRLRFTSRQHPLNHFSLYKQLGIYKSLIQEVSIRSRLTGHVWGPRLTNYDYLLLPFLRLRFVGEASRHLE